MRNKIFNSLVNFHHYGDSDYQNVSLQFDGVFFPPRWQLVLKPVAKLLQVVLSGNPF